MYMLSFVAMINHLTILVVLVPIMQNAEAEKLIPLPTLPASDIFVNAEKGFVLQHVGTYSSKLDKGLLHTFIPILDFYKASLDVDLGLDPSKLIDRNMLQLSNIISSSNTIVTSKYDQTDISRLVIKDIRDTLAAHQPGQFIKNITTNFHIFDNHFYASNNVTQDTKLISYKNIITSQHASSFLSKNPVAIILDQRIHNKIGFDFLTNAEVVNFIIPVMSSMDQSYANSDQETLMADFSRLIISQSVHILRSCSIDLDDMEKSPSCLIVSTLFKKLPRINPFTFTVYRLTPMPIFIDGYKYIYTNLPTMIGINVIEQSLIMWNDGHEQSTCEFTKIVQCRQQPIPVPLSNIPCLAELLSIDESRSTVCQVTKSLDFSPAFTEIAQDIWVFHNVEKNQHCKLYSTSEDLTDVVTVDEPSVLHLSCQKAVKCFDLELPPPTCTNKKIMIKSNLTGTYHTVGKFQLPLRKLITRLVSAYKAMARDSIKQLLDEVNDLDPPLKKTFKKFADLITYTALLLPLAAILIIARIIKVKLQRQVDKVEREMNKIADIFSVDTHPV